MSVVHPVLMVDDGVSERVLNREHLRGDLGQDVEFITSFDEVLAAVQALRDSPEAGKPTVVLDAGLPGICRLETVWRAAVLLEGRANVVLWTGVDAVAAHVGALIDGAKASLPKSLGPAELTKTVRQVMRDRRCCTSAQAQYLAHLLESVQHHVDTGTTRGWTTSELGRCRDQRDAMALWRDRLDALADGDELGSDDAWFGELLSLVRPLWLPPHMRRTLAALCVTTSAAAAAGALDLSLRSVYTNRDRLRVRLQPTWLLRTRIGGSRERAPDEHDEEEFDRLLFALHNGCELPRRSHDLSKEAFGVRDRQP